MEHGLYAIVDDAGRQLALCSFTDARECVGWHQLWHLQPGETILDGAFANRRDVKQEFVAEITMKRCTTSSEVWRRYDKTVLYDILDWIAERQCVWALHSQPLRDRLSRTEQGVFAFSFADLVMATEFKLTWG